MGVGSNPTSDNEILPANDRAFPLGAEGGFDLSTGMSLTTSRVAQWKRAGPITQRSVDRNYALLVNLFVTLLGLSVFFSDCAKTVGRPISAEDSALDF